MTKQNSTGQSQIIQGDVFATPLYSVGTWDMDEQAYTPQVGLSVPSQNVPWRTLLRVVRELRDMGYSCHYRRDILVSCARHCDPMSSNPQARRGRGMGLQRLHPRQETCRLQRRLATALSGMRF